MICTGLPVVSCPYMPAAEMPIPCCPRLMRSRWNFDPYRSFANIGGICWRTMPGPLSVTVTRKRVAWLAGGGAPLLGATSSVTTTSGRMPASSHASSALSTASLTQVRSAFLGLSKPSRCRFLVKNSETEISRCRAPISTAETAAAGLAGAFLDTTVAISSLIADRRFAPRLIRLPGSGAHLAIDLAAVAAARAALHERLRRCLAPAVTPVGAVDPLVAARERPAGVVEGDRDLAVAGASVLPATVLDGDVAGGLLRLVAVRVPVHL